MHDHFNTACHQKKKNVLDILGLGDNKCKPMPTPIVQTRQKGDEDLVKKTDELVTDALAFSDILKYRPDLVIS